MSSNIDLSELKEVFNFKYFETYSLQRGSDYEKVILEKEELYNQLINKSKLENLSLEENLELKILNSLLNNTQFLFDKNRKLHFSAEKLNRFYPHENESEELIKILQIKTEKIPSWMCGPVYRDAIVFYDRENEIREVLNICFSCEFIQNFNQDFIDVDESVYDGLKQLLLRFGHNIEANQ